jgi:endonuclease/exonuclease/phosphatase (EEP) superfamily protein YafD
MRRRRFGRSSRRTVARALALVAIAAALAGCITLTQDPRAVVYRSGQFDVQRLRCDDAAAAALTARSDDALDADAIRVVSWNIHKQADEGWQRDLERFARAADLVLLQEVELEADLPELVESAGHSWVMASSWIYGNRDIGVLTASRVPPVASCTERIGEPLIVLPKSAVITWYRIAGFDLPLAVVNIHAINFTLTLDAYELQMRVLADALDQHRGPVVFAGDFNTWSDARREALGTTLAKLDLVETKFADDRRKLFLGKQLDHIFVRGLDVVESTAIAVKSSDHNPMTATLRVNRK